MTPSAKFAVVLVAARPRPELAVLADDAVCRLDDLLGEQPGDLGPVPVTLADLLADWDAWTERIETALASGRPAPASWLDADIVEFLPPTIDHPTIYCAGANYYDHVKEMGEEPPSRETSHPFHFVTPPAALTGHGSDVVRPPGIRLLDWEIELAAVIGRTAYKVPAERALDHIAGYTVANDVSCRDPHAMRVPLFGIDWLSSKAAATLLPLGPGIVPARHVPDPQRLSLTLTVNGTVRQRSSTAEMIFTVAEQLAHLSALRPLHPGDVVLTGTPAGTAAAHDRYLRDGDRMTATIAGVGRLTNTVT